MVIELQLSQSAKLRTTAHRIGRARDNVESLTMSIAQTEADIALDKEMDTLYYGLGYEKKDVEMIKAHAFKARDRILGELLGEQK